jgi:hypothetical protein
MLPKYVVGFKRKHRLNGDSTNKLLRFIEDCLVCLCVREHARARECD